MKGIDVIIPVHKYDTDIAGLLKRCLESVKEMSLVNKQNDVTTNVYIVGDSLPNEDIMNLVEWGTDIEEFTFVENKSGKLDFCSQVNYAVNNACGSDYFMIVEFDDMVTPKWVQMAMPYIESRPKCPAFLPLVETYDIKNPTMPLHYINEIGWSSAFVENELGSLNNEALQEYCNFNLTGAIIKRTDFLKSGGLKPSMKLSFNYELLLRLSNLYNEVYVVPKVGYFHFVNREDSLTSEYHRTMSQEEGSWWIKLAIQEYHFKKDREKTYTPDEE